MERRPSTRPSGRVNQWMLRQVALRQILLAPKRVGELMFPLAQQFVQPPVLVTDDEIRAAQKALWEGARVVAEPGGAAAFAAVLSGKYVPVRNERVCVLVCGANTAAVKFD